MGLFDALAGQAAAQMPQGYDPASPTQAQIQQAAQASAMQGSAPGLRAMTNDQLANMSNSDLMDMRNRFNGQQWAQDLVAPYEHRAWAREHSGSPISAAIEAVAVPAYQAAKAMGVMHGRTPASSQELTQGWAGVIDGLLNQLGAR